jgi:hypothetical protein
MKEDEKCTNSNVKAIYQLHIFTNYADDIL